MSEIISFFLGKYRTILTCCECMCANGIWAVSMGGCGISGYIRARTCEKGPCGIFGQFQFFNFLVAHNLKITPLKTVLKNIASSLRYECFC